MMNPLSKMAAALVLAAALAACGQNRTGEEEGGEGEGRNLSSTAAAMGQSEMRMHEAMEAAVGADVSDTWLRKMIAHHEGAIAMADSVIAEARDPRVAAMARRIKAQQTREIEEMRRLIRTGSAPDPASARPYAEGEKKMHDSMMTARADDPSQAFLARMIPHHQGAIDMSRVVLDQGRDERVAAIARRVIADQSKEIAEMQTILSGAAPGR